MPISQSHWSIPELAPKIQLCSPEHFSLRGTCKLGMRLQRFCKTLYITLFCLSTDKSTSRSQNICVLCIQFLFNRYDATPGSTASLPRLPTQRTVHQHASWSSQHQRQPRQTVSNMRPINKLPDQKAPKVPQKPRPQSASSVASSVTTKYVIM